MVSSICQSTKSVLLKFFNGKNPQEQIFTILAEWIIWNPFISDYFPFLPSQVRWLCSSAAKVDDMKREMDDLHSEYIWSFSVSTPMCHDLGLGRSMRLIYISHLSHSHSCVHACTNVHALERSKHFLIDIWVRNDSEKGVSIFCFLQHTVFNVSLFYIPIFLMYGGKSI